jgi:hypothetical protein
LFLQLKPFVYLNSASEKHRRSTKTPPRGGVLEALDVTATGSVAVAAIVLAALLTLLVLLIRLALLLLTGLLLRAALLAGFLLTGGPLVLLALVRRLRIA